jgi:flagellar hook-length control protein FliK
MAAATLHVASPASVSTPAPISMPTTSSSQKESAEPLTTIKEMPTGDKTVVVSAQEVQPEQPTRKLPQTIATPVGTDNPPQPMQQPVLPPQAGPSKIGTSRPEQHNSIDDTRDMGTEIKSPELREQTSKLTAPKHDLAATPDSAPLVGTATDGALTGELPFGAESDSPFEFTSDPARIETPKELARILADPRVPRHIAAQLADLARKMPNGPVELSLNPEELGRVRMTLHATEHSMTVTLAVERNETADLLRRNLDTLVQDFRAMGYRDVSFSFAEGQTNRDSRQDSLRSYDTRSSSADADTDAKVNAPMAPQASMTLGRGMDLRL